jgi:alpha-beta hydrolase superfamily lysophospholipase
VSRPVLVGRIVAAGAAGWGAACGLVYWQTFRRLPRTHRDSRQFTPADFELDYEELEVRTDDRLRLITWLLPGTRNAVVVVSGGYRGHISDVLGIGAALRRAGFSVVAYGWRGTPGSDAGPHTLGANECRDLTAVLDAVRGRLGPLPIGLLGYSMGGAVSISVAADDPGVRAVCADSAFADPVSLLEERIHHRLHLPAAVLADPVMALMARRTGARLADFSPVTAVARLAPRPLLLIHGDADTSVPVEHAHRLYAAAGSPKDLWVIPGLGHVGGYFADRTAYVERVTGFFDCSLGEAAGRST